MALLSLTLVLVPIDSYSPVLYHSSSIFRAASNELRALSEDSVPFEEEEELPEDPALGKVEEEEEEEEDDADDKEAEDEEAASDS